MPINPYSNRSNMLYLERRTTQFNTLTDLTYSIYISINPYSNRSDVLYHVYKPSRSKPLSTNSCVVHQAGRDPTPKSLRQVKPHPSSYPSQLSAGSA